MRALPIALLVVLAGCELVVDPQVAASGASSSSGTGGSGSSGTSTGSSGSSGSSSSSSGSSGASPVSGTVIDRFVSATAAPALVEQPHDLTHRRFGAFTGDVDAGYAYVDGGFGSDGGSFVIAAVPPGRMVLLNGTNPLEISRHTGLDLGANVLGRPGEAKVPGPLPVSVDITNLAAMRASDRIELVALNGAFLVTALQKALQLPDGGPVPYAGQTELSGELDWSTSSTGNAVDPDAGDALYLTQLVTRDAGASDAGAQTAVVLARFADLSGARIIDAGTSLAASANLPVGVPVPADLTLQRDPQFERDFPAQDAFTAAHVDVVVLPEAGGTRPTFSGPPLLYSLETSAPGLLQLQAQTTAFDVFPTAWNKLVCFGINYQRTLSTGLGATDGINHCELFGSSATASLAPVLSAARNLRLNGQDAAPDLTGVGVAPLLGWDAPAQGASKVQKYVVNVYRLSTSPAASHLWSSFTVVHPSGAQGVWLGFAPLATGTAYYATVTAVAEPMSDFSTAPYRSSLPTDSSTTSTGVFTP